MEDDDDDFEDWLIAREECIMDLDDKELEATRKLNGATKESNKENEYLKELKKNEEVVRRVDISANLNAIILTLINKGLIKENEFQKLFEKSKEAIYRKMIKDLTKEQKEQLKASKRFRELFGGIF